MNKAGDSGSAFIVSGLDQPEADSDLLGVWACSPRGSDSLQAFSIGSVTVPGWRAVLPSDAAEATSHVASAEAALGQVVQVLPHAERQLAGALETTGASSGASRFLSFASPAASTPEAQLADALRDLREDGPAMSFGLADWKADWDAASRRASAAISQLHAGMIADGVVETQIGAELIGQTRVGLVGAERTVWWASCTPSQAALHCRTVALSVASRIAVINLLAVVVRGAARASAMLALPGGPLLAVPSVMRFINAAIRDEGR